MNRMTITQYLKLRDRKPASATAILGRLTTMSQKEQERHRAWYMKNKQKLKKEKNQTELNH